MIGWGKLILSWCKWSIDTNKDPPICARYQNNIAPVLSAVSNTQKCPSPSIGKKKESQKKGNYLERTCWINGVRCLMVIYKFYSGLPGLIVLIRRENKSNYSRAWSAEEAKTRSDNFQSTLRTISHLRLRTPSLSPSLPPSLSLSLSLCHEPLYPGMYAVS